MHARARGRQSLADSNKKEKNIAARAAFCINGLIVNALIAAMFAKNCALTMPQVVLTFGLDLL